ncbi:hypothetical protein Ahy_A01g002773 [Arachis hypogaea]|uniref:FAR1 domain-containing protein n=1 Tax=Arachis hypogaea TaxID=3818 RepID=A0A445ERP9_ARAHY|nr:hypothetical protein Ahy_A01g002773 [Arachis hypogaea]
MEFNTPEEAKGFDNNYRHIKGFATRQGKKVTNIVKEIIRYTFVCNREGFREKKWLEKTDRKREHKVVTCCGCVAKMRIKRKDGSGKWKISEVEIAHITSMRDIGISISKIYESFVAQFGGFNMVSFTKYDMYNEERRQRALQDGDVNAAIRFLEGVGRVDGKMFWRHRLDIKTDEFKVIWEAILNECGMREVEWVQELYRKKYSWATAYIRGRFFVGNRTTCRCESLLAKLGRFVKSRYGVIEFVTNFQRCVDFLRDNEDELEF